MTTCTAVFCNNLLTNSASSCCPGAQAGKLMVVQPPQESAPEMGTCSPALLPGRPHVQHISASHSCGCHFSPTKLIKSPNLATSSRSHRIRAASGQVPLRLANGLCRRQGWSEGSILRMRRPTVVVPQYRLKFHLKNSSSKEVLRLFPDKATAHQTNREALGSTRCCTCSGHPESPLCLRAELPKKYVVISTF